MAGSSTLLRWRGPAQIARQLPIRGETLDRTTLQLRLLSCEGLVRQFVKRQLGDDLRPLVSAEDVLQETWISAFQHSAGFQSEGEKSFERWLLGIAARTVIKMAKRARRFKRNGGQAAQLPEDDPLSSSMKLLNAIDGASHTPSRAAFVQEVADVIRGMLRRLPDERQRAVQMRYLEGKSVKEICRQTGKSRPAVRSLIYNALRQMREELGSPSLFFSDAPTTKN